MATTAEQRAMQALFHLQIGPERTLDLSVELLRQLGVEPGAVLSFSVHAGYALLHKAPTIQEPHTVEVEPIPDLEGSLADYFAGHDDVLRSIEEERSGKPFTDTVDRSPAV